MPHFALTSLLLVATAASAASAATGALRLVGRLQHFRRLPPLLALAALAAIAIGLLWHTLAHQPHTGWVPFGDNAGALLWLAVVLSGFVVYVQLRRPLAGLEALMMPVVVLLLAAALSAQRWLPRDYDVRGLWAGLHVVASFAGAAAFAVAGVTGALYLRQSSRLRHKGLPDGSGVNTFGSLERLESSSFTAVTLGFALLTVGLITGAARLADAGQALRLTPKILLALAVWIVYALVLHAPILPNLAAFRGRKAAWLSMAGFALMLGTLAAAQLVPAVQAQPASAQGASAQADALAGEVRP